MPKPDNDETQKHFISRCIPTVINEGTTKDSKQAAAICYSIWKEHLKKRRKKSRGSLLLEAMAKSIKKENNGAG